MSQLKNYNALHFASYLSGGINNTINYWQAVDITTNNRFPVSKNIPINNSNNGRRYLQANLSAFCEETLGQALATIEYPGGKQRSSFRLILENDQSIIASRRAEIGRAVLEERVLHHLAKHNAPVPKVLAFNGLVILQEDVGSQRLSSALDDANEALYISLLSKALDSLLSIHKAAKHENLEHYVPILGGDNDWLSSFIERPLILGNYLNLPPPTPDLSSIRDLLTLIAPRFIKWDARPGNAALTDQQEVVWFDWEHCGARNRLDDLIWMLCDESTPYFPSAEKTLLDKYISRFQDGLNAEHAHSYTRVFGVLHCCTRLALILSKKKNNDWGNHKEILEGDKVGVTLEQAQRLCQRASDWCKYEPMIETLSPWFLAVSKHLTTI